MDANTQGIVVTKSQKVNMRDSWYYKNIKHACEGGKNGKYKTCKGYNWMYYKDYKKLENIIC